MGVGAPEKMYLWKEFTRTERKRIQETFYSYVSLFGATSLSHVKGLVVLSGDATDDSNKLTSGWQRTKNWVIRKRRYFDQLKLPYLGSIGIAIAASSDELLIQNFLVCLDDLERRNPGLDFEQVFGLVSVL